MRGGGPVSRRAHPRRSSAAALGAARGHRKYGYLILEKDPVNELIKELQGGKQGRKLLRNASRVTLEFFTEQTYEEVMKLDLKKSGKGWRKALKKKGSYKYKSKGTAKGTFSFWTGINYAKQSILKVSHLVERGFSHADAGRVRGLWFRDAAFKLNRPKAMKLFSNSLMKGMDILAGTKRAPTLKELRSLTR